MKKLITILLLFVSSLVYGQNGYYITFNENIMEVITATNQLIAEVEDDSVYFHNIDKITHQSEMYTITNIDDYIKFIEFLTKTYGEDYPYFLMMLENFITLRKYEE